MSIQYLINQVKNNPDLHIYDIGLSEYESPVITGTQSFGSQIFIIDQFQGKRPRLINSESINSNTYSIHLIPTIILDSNIASKLNNYYTNKIMKPDEKKATEELLKWISKRNYDFSPFFYFIESIWKDSPIESVIPTAASILGLHAMNEKIFLETGDIVYKIETINHYYEQYGSSSLEQCAQIMLSHIDKTTIQFYIPLINATYATLLKMVLIHKKNNAPFLEKLSEFEDFLYKDIGAKLSRESLVAAYYFADLLGSMIGVQSNSKLENAKRNLKATAWDIFLLRMPELFLNPAHLPEMNVAYVCTAEKKLAEVGNLFEIERLIYSSNTAIPMSQIMTSYDLLEKKIGVETVSNIFDLNENITKNYGITYNRFNEHNLKYLINDLEHQLSHLCRG